MSESLPATRPELEAAHTKSSLKTLDDLRVHEAGCKRCRWVGGTVVDGKRTMQRFHSCPEYRQIKKDGQRRTEQIMRAIERMSRLERV
jgi:endonuclease V-like protein UPF0215 family